MTSMTTEESSSEVAGRICTHNFKDESARKSVLQRSLVVSHYWETFCYKIEFQLNFTAYDQSKYHAKTYIVVLHSSVLI